MKAALRFIGATLSLILSLVLLLVGPLYYIPVKAEPTGIEDTLPGEEQPGHGVEQLDPVEDNTPSEGDKDNEENKETESGGDTEGDNQNPGNQEGENNGENGAVEGQPDEAEGNPDITDPEVPEQPTEDSTIIKYEYFGDKVLGLLNLKVITEKMDKGLFTSLTSLVAGVLFTIWITYTVRLAKANKIRRKNRKARKAQEAESRKHPIPTPVQKKEHKGNKIQF